ncbi:Histidine--tRNA ligase, partial [Bienertia sinuspersici]
MPEFGFKASNIDSRLSYLKKKFNALLEIKNKGSGFGWDDNLKMVTGDRKLFEEWSKSHKEAKGMFRKPFPLFDDLEEIYAKDRATVLKSAMPADRDDEDLSHNATKNPTEVSSSNQDDDVPTLVSGISKRIVEEGSSKKVTKKKKTTKDIQNVQKSLETKMKKNGPKNIKVGLREELGRVPGISRENALFLCVKMTEDEIVIFRYLMDDDE